VAGGGTPTLLGPGGVLAGIADVFGDISSGRFKESPLDFLSTAISAVNTYQNSKNLKASNEVRSIINSTVTGTINQAANEIVQNRTGGLNKIVVPVGGQQADTTKATQRNLP
jgi:hypothetical protein